MIIKKIKMNISQLVIIFLSISVLGGYSSRIPIKLSYLRKSSENLRAQHPHLSINRVQSNVVNQPTATNQKKEIFTQQTANSKQKGQHIHEKFFDCLLDYVQAVVGAIVVFIFRFILNCFRRFCLKQKMTFAQMV